MYRVIDTIRCSVEMQQRNPALWQLGDGLLVILDPHQIQTAPMTAGSTVRVSCPDGTVTERSVTSVHVPHSAVGLFFANTEQHEIPRGSQIELVAAA